MTNPSNNQGPSKAKSKSQATTAPNSQEPVDLADQTRVRREKLEKQRQRGQAYPHQVKVTHVAAKVLQEYGEEQDPARLQSVSVQLAGRVAFVRSFGKAGFVKIRDRSGVLQLYVARDKASAESFAVFEDLDLGDWVQASGVLFRTKTGELSVEVREFRCLSKCLHAPPEKFHGLQDVEERYRKRYLDLMSSPETRDVFVKRSKIVQGIRDYFNARDYIEVETPMMHTMVTGATARPFSTHHNALDMNLFLRIAPELHLKRLVVGGFERVFEINRNFRNEGISVRHNPEFTMLEFYQAYATYKDLMDMTEELIEGLALKICGSSQLSWMGQSIELKRPWKRLLMQDAVREMSSFKGSLSDASAMKAYLQSAGVTLTGREGHGALLNHIFELDVSDRLIQPTFITGYPVEVSPLARRSDEKSELGFDFTDRFELYVNGIEIANGFNELNDPDDQRSRFESQATEKAAGNSEATDYDEDYCLALEYGLPPTAGEGIGIDRLAMMLTGSDSIRDVILFPLMKKLT
jgi:lysyl-tRNA synthetase class 2